MTTPIRTETLPHRGLDRFIKLSHLSKFFLDGQHRTIAASAFDGSFDPILPFGKLEIHTVFLRFQTSTCAKISRRMLLPNCAELPQNKKRGTAPTNHF